MHNIHELEQRWIKYKIKVYLPYVISLIFASVLFVVLIFINDTKKEIPNTTSSVNENIEKTIKKPKLTQTEIKKVEDTKLDNTIKPKKVEKSVADSIYEKTDEQDKKLTLKPSLDFMKKLRTDSINSYDNEETTVYNTQPNYKNNYNQALQNTIEQPKNDYQESTDMDEEVVKPKISISTKETKNDIQHVIKRFKKNNNPALSLFVAKKYYKLGDYKKAYDYALITNEINNDIEDSWIIFAKSLVKLNKKDLAIKTLSKYVRHSHSGNAKVLLDDIKSGKFR